MYPSNGLGAMSGSLALARPSRASARSMACELADVHVSYANRNETKHLPYGEGTLRAEPLAEALAGFERPATVITESPDHESDQAIRAILVGD